MHRCATSACIVMMHLSVAGDGKKQKASNAESQQVLPPLMPGWNEIWCNKKKAFYYHFVGTSIVVWDRPSVPSDPAGSTVAPAPTPTPPPPSAKGAQQKRDFIVRLLAAKDVLTEVKIPQSAAAVNTSASPAGSSTTPAPPRYDCDGMHCTVCRRFASPRCNTRFAVLESAAGIKALQTAAKRTPPLHLRKAARRGSRRPR